MTNTFENPENTYVIMPIDYVSPILSIRHCLANTLFNSKESAESFLCKSVNNLPSLARLLKVVKVPPQQLWRIKHTYHPYQLYPVGMHVTALDGNTSSISVSSQYNNLLEHLTKHISETTPKATLQHILNVLSGRLDLLSVVDEPFLSRNCAMYQDLPITESMVAAVIFGRVYRVDVASICTGYSISTKIAQDHEQSLTRISSLLIVPCNSFQEKLL